MFDQSLGELAQLLLAALPLADQLGAYAAAANIAEALEALGFEAPSPPKEGG